MKKMKNSNTRRGLSLLEILLSVFVLSVGLLGMLAVLPYAILQLSTVNRLDFASNCGRAALNEIKTRKFASDYLTSFLDPSDRTDYLTVGGNPVGLLFRNDRPFIVDPLLLENDGQYSDGNRVNWPGPNSTTNDFDLYFYPYGPFSSSSTSLYRITCQLTQPSINSGTTSYPPRPTLAQEIFYWDEDLNFAAPGSPTVNNPRPILMHNSANQPQSLNNYSWFYMVTPIWAGQRRDDDDTANPVGIYVREKDVSGYNIDVVVFYNRSLPTVNDLSRDLSNSTYSDIVKNRLNEVQVNVTNMQIGMGGGSMTIEPMLGRTVEDLDMTETRWVLLSCQPKINDTPSDTTVVAKWYEVVGLGDINNGARELILAGPSIPTANDYYVTIVKGVCGVFSEYIAK